MAERLPSRPNLEHLRRQAKSLLAAVAAGEATALQTLREHLPAAAGMSDAAIRRAAFRLADAQSAIARQSGFAGWPALSRHVETLRGLEGSWAFVSLVADGVVVPADDLRRSCIRIDGDCFRTESPGATYEGTFDLDVEAAPMRIDIHFAQGPEAGVSNHGIFVLAGDRLELCLDVNGRERPRGFGSRPGSGHAHEVLTRASQARPAAVDGGKARRSVAPPPAVVGDAAVLAFVGPPTPLLAELQGSWSAVRIVRDGTELPPPMLAHARREARGPELEITIGGRLLMRAAVRLGAAAAVVPVDYLHLGGELAGRQQAGIFTWQGDQACFCMAPPGAPRPADFACAVGSGRTLSIWRRDA